MICAAEFATQENINLWHAMRKADLHTDECSAGRTAWAFTDGF